MFFNKNISEWGFCPKAIVRILDMDIPSVTLTVSAIEIYFNECFDLLNNKASIPISGYRF